MGERFAGCFCTSDAARERARCVFVGLPDDSQSSYRQGCALGPGRIRIAYDGDCYNASTELGVDLSGAVRDLGDLASGASFAETARRYQEAVERVLRDGRTPFLAGGDHAVTVPVVAALAVLERPVHVLQIDAHPDLYDEFQGSRSSHACVAARLLEMPHVATLTQLGVRTLNAEQCAVAERYRDRLRTIPARECARGLPPPLPITGPGPVFLTVDLDAFDPAFAPGVSHPVPGGFTPRQVLDFVQAIGSRLVAMDVVELNPTRDQNDLTAVLAARLLHEGMGLVHRQRS